MTSNLKITSKVFVRSFYQENTSFFLLVLGLAGGFMSAVEHIALAEFFLASPMLMMIPVAVWVLYGIKIINFNNSILKRGENEFLYSFILYPRVEQWTIAVSLIFSQFAPAILYGCFLLSRAAMHGLVQPILLILCCQLAIGFMICFRLLEAIGHPNSEKKNGRLTRIVNRNFVRGYPLFVIEWISRKQPVMLISTKLFGGALLFGVLQLYTTDTYDSRLLSMALVVATASSAQLIFEMHRFDNYHFSLTRQLPISMGKRILYATVSLALLSLFETGVIVTYFPPNLSIPDLVMSLLYICTTQLFLYGFLYRKNIHQEKQTVFVFSASMLWIVLILFNVPLWVPTVVNLTAGVYLWGRFYYRFEFLSTN